jgi:hypothetical protein
LEQQVYSLFDYNCKPKHLNVKARLVNYLIDYNYNLKKSQKVYLVLQTRKASLLIGYNHRKQTSCDLAKQANLLVGYFCNIDGSINSVEQEG